MPQPTRPRPLATRLARAALGLGRFVAATLVIFVTCALLVSCSMERSLQEEVAQIVRDPATGIARGLEPYTLQGTNTEVAFLFVHGFHGTPWELRPLADYVNTQGYTVEAILLPGHGTTPMAIAETTPLDWHDSAWASYVEMKKTYARVYYVGSSTGATIGLDLASEHHLDGLILVSPFMKVTRPWFVVVSPESFARLGPLFFRVVKGSKGNVINDPEGRRRHYCFEHVPTASIVEVLDYAREVREKLSNVDEPLLVLHSRDDKASSPEGSEEIMGAAASQTKRLVWFEKSGHLLALDYDRDGVCRAVGEFVEAQERGRGDDNAPVGP